MTAAQFVDTLNTNSGNRCRVGQEIGGLRSDLRHETPIEGLRAVAEDPE